MTNTLNQLRSNIRTVRGIITLDMCAELFVKPTRGSEDIERTRDTVIQC